MRTLSYPVVTCFLNRIDCVCQAGENMHSVKKLWRWLVEFGHTWPDAKKLLECSCATFKLPLRGSHWTHRTLIWPTTALNRMLLFDTKKKSKKILVHPHSAPTDSVLKDCQLSAEARLLSLFGELLFFWPIEQLTRKPHNAWMNRLSYSSHLAPFTMSGIYLCFPRMRFFGLWRRL